MLRASQLPQIVVAHSFYPKACLAVEGLLSPETYTTILDEHSDLLCWGGWLITLLDSTKLQLPQAMGIPAEEWGTDLLGYGVLQD